MCHPTALDVQVAELKAKLAVMEAERDAQDAPQRHAGFECLMSTSTAVL